MIASGRAFDVQASTFNAAGKATATLVDSNYATTNATGAGTESVTAAGTGGNQTDDPLFVTPALADYRQVEGSPTIDKGSTDTHSGALDLDGEERTMGEGTDIGADEFTVADPPTPPPPPPPPPPADDKQAPQTTITGAPKSR